MSTNEPFVEPYPGYAAENKGPLILGVTSALTLVTLLFVAGRVWSRTISLGKLAVDDFIVIGCIILSILYVGLAGAAIEAGGGRHASTLKPEQIQRAVYYTVISFVPGVSSFIVPKFAGVILVAKLLNPGKAHVIFMWIISVLYFLLALGMLIINFCQCTPIAAQWGGAVGTCIDRKITVDYALTLGIVSVCFDLYLALYPTVVLWRLQMHWKKKLGLSLALGFGYCAAVVTIYKCKTLEGLLTLTDFTYAVDDVVLWTNIEANFVLIGVCIPTLFPLAKKLFGNSVLGNSYGSGPSGGKGVSGDVNPVATIGSMPKKKKSKAASQFDTLNDDDSKYIILEERSFHQTTSEVRSEDMAALEEGRGTRHKNW
ncbi:hypothetical protein QBC39DRAFT_308119 [Podospora conica]|nr:hypothetical protein QBC39DRAFT_308119 [Schizothecium conicum]